MSNKSPKISVIIPVYNTEKHLRECLDSVLSQSFTDFEVLLINDGSTDGSGEICDEYAQKDNRIKVFHKENGGVSSARNLGLDNAKGEWITFVDSDDLIGLNYFDPVKQTYNFDLIVLNIKRRDERGLSEFVKLECKEYSLEGFLENYKLYHDFSGPCGKFYKSEIIKYHNISFDQSVSFGEDSLFNLEYIFHCKSIKVTNQTFYIYNNNNSSLSKAVINLQKEEYLFFKINGILSSYKTKYENLQKHLDFVIHRYFFSILDSELSYKEKRNKLRYLISNYRNVLIDVLKKDYFHGVRFSTLLKYHLEILVLLKVYIINKK